jgi:hypothetical protein
LGKNSDSSAFVVTAGDVEKTAATGETETAVVDSPPDSFDNTRSLFENQKGFVEKALFRERGLRVADAAVHCHLFGRHIRKSADRNIRLLPHFGKSLNQSCIGSSERDHPIGFARRPGLRRLSRPTMGDENAAAVLRDKRETYA